MKLAAVAIALLLLVAVSASAAPKHAPSSPSVRCSDAKLKKRVINEGLKFYLADNQQSWDMNGDGDYQRRRSARAKPHSAQSDLMLTLGS